MDDPWIPETLAVGCEASAICIVVTKMIFTFLKIFIYLFVFTLSYWADICTESAWIKLVMP